MKTINASLRTFKKEGTMEKILKTSLLVLLCLAFGFKTNSQTIGGVAFGVALDRLTDRLGDLIRQAENSGNIVVTQAGGQVALAIQNAKAAYQSELDLTVDRLNSQQKSLLDDLTSKINAIEQQSVRDMQDIINRGQTAFNIIPLSNTLPQISGYTPIYCALNSPDQNVAIEIAGNFYDLSREDYDAVLFYNGKTLNTKIKTTTQLVFEIPLSELYNSENRLTSIPIFVKVPYKTGWWIFGKQRASMFKLLITTLPKTAGQIHFTAIKNVPDIERRNNESDIFRQESDDDDFKERQHCWPASAGWRIVPNTVHAMILWKQGAEGNGKDWWWNNNTSTLASACMTLTTIHHTWGTSGKVHFRLLFAEERDILREEKTEADIPLEWGTTKILDFPVGGTWKSTYTDFTGRTSDISIPFNSPFLKVLTSGNQVSFTTVAQ